MNNRIKEYDVAKAIGMFMVVFGHLPLSQNADIIKRFDSSFHMPLFFILSGLCLKDYYGFKFSDLFSKIGQKTFGYLIPFVLWNCIFAKFSIKNLVLICYGSNTSIGMAGGVAATWFLTCLYLAVIINMFLTKIFRNNIVRVLLSVAIAILGFIITSKISIKYGMPFNLNIGLIAQGFVMIGFMSKNLFSYLKEKSVIVNSIICLINFGVNLGVVYLNSSVLTNSFGRVVMAIGLFGNSVLFFISSVIGSLFILELSILICKLFRKVAALEICGENTLIILCIHPFIINFISTRIDLINCNLLMGILISLLVVVTCCFASILIKKLIPELAGLSFPIQPEK